jgi:hypothetical protein
MTQLADLRAFPKTVNGLLAVVCCSLFSLRFYKGQQAADL